MQLCRLLYLLSGFIEGKTNGAQKAEETVSTGDRNLCSWFLQLLFPLCQHRIKLPTPFISQFLYLVCSLGVLAPDSFETIGTCESDLLFCSFDC